MADQNFLAKLLCSLAKDQYTREGTFQSLDTVYEEAKKKNRTLDLRRDKFILFSDLHRGAKDKADDFAPCEAAYCAALAYYLEMDYTLCVMGDAEELWEETPDRVLKNNHTSFLIERLFHENGHYLRLSGNHDDTWQKPKNVRIYLQPFYGEAPLHVHQAILLHLKLGGEILGEILLIHGQQGTQNEGSKTWFAKWVLHNIWRPIQQMTGFSCNTPASDWRLRNDRDKVLYEWTVQHPGLILIAGHTHAPVFASRSHRLRLIEELRAARHALSELPRSRHRKRNEEREKIAGLSAELKWIENQISEEEKQASPVLENPKPCYFNTGCCAFSDGDITGIEIANGQISLVRWPDDKGQPVRKYLQPPTSLRRILKELK